MLRLVAPLLWLLMLPGFAASGDPLQPFVPGPAALDRYTGKGRWVVLKILGVGLRNLQ